MLYLCYIEYTQYFYARPDENMIDVSGKIAAFLEKLLLWKEDITERIWKFLVLYFYLNKSTNQTNLQRCFHRAFISYIDIKLIMCAIINILLLVASQAQQTFPKASQGKNFENH